MTGCADLHIHSSYSDGNLSPRALIKLAQQQGIQAIAVTDHDTTEGLHDPAFTEPHELVIVPGVELSAHHELGSVHILGYGLDIEDSELQKKLQTIQAARCKRNNAICERLQKQGINISATELETIATGQIGRPHIAQLLVQKGNVANEPEAFLRFLRKGASAYVSRDLLPAEEAIQAIHQAGGLAVFAHPATVDPTCIFLHELIHALCDAGLDGLEVFHPAHNKKHIAFLTRICEERALGQTGGSDFHGRQRDRTQMGYYATGKTIPYKTFEWLDSTLHLKRNMPQTAHSKVPHNCHAHHTHR